MRYYFFTGSVSFLGALKSNGTTSGRLILIFDGAFLPKIRLPAGGAPKSIARGTALRSWDTGLGSSFFTLERLLLSESGMNCSLDAESPGDGIPKSNTFFTPLSSDGVAPKLGDFFNDSVISASIPSIYH
jgi:hypothetical protein